MTSNIRDDFAPYWDCNDLLAPNPITAMLSDKAGSDNGPMFTSEYYVMLAKSGLLAPWDREKFSYLIGRCIAAGLLNRYTSYIAPSSQEGPDDYLGVLNACRHLSIVSVPRQFLGSVVSYFGALNNVAPGKWTYQSFLIRQPQLIAAMVSSAFPEWSLAHFLIRVIFFPFYLVSAIVIAISCINTPTDSADPRRLSWHLLQIVKGHSILCYLASLIWYRRLYKHYGPDGMKAVAAEYYFPKGLNANPYSKYWIS